MCLVTGQHLKCHFALGLPSESLEIPKIGTFVTLKAHNFACRPLIKVRSESKVVVVIKSFLAICGSPLIHKEVKAIPNF
jgi:hypothetical protein